MASRLEDSLEYVISEIEYHGQLFRKRQKRVQRQKSEGARKWNDEAPAHWNQAATDTEKLARRLRREFNLRKPA